MEAAGQKQAVSSTGNREGLAGTGLKGSLREALLEKAEIHREVARQ